MMEMINKVLGFLKMIPSFSGLLNKVVQGVKIDPIDVASAFIGINPSIEKGAFNAINAVKKGGSLTDAATAMINIGEVTLPNGRKVDTRTLIPSMKETGGKLSDLANAFEAFQKQDPIDVADLGEKACDINNWKDLVS